MKLTTCLRSAYIFAALLLSIAGSAWSTDNFAGEILNLGAGARFMGMGSASAAMVDDATSTYYNPAGLTRLGNREVNLMHSEQFGGLETYNTVSFAAPVTDNESIGLTLLHVGVGDIKYTRLWDPSQAPGDSNRVEVASREDASDYALYLSGAKRFRENLSIGAAVKLIRRAIGDDTAFGYGIDLGAQYTMGSHWLLGVNLRDVTGTAVAWDGKANDRISMTMDAGVAFTDQVPFFGGRYILSASAYYFGDTPETKGVDTMNIGGEYLFRDLVAFRTGYSQGSATFGMGVRRLPLLSSSALDYAFLSHEELDRTHRVSLTVGF